MTPDDAARIHQVARVLAEPGPAADALRGLLRMALGPLPLPVVAPAPLVVEPVVPDETPERQALRQFAARFPSVMAGWFK